VIATIAVGKSPQDLVWNPARNRVYSANSVGSSISVLDDAGGVEEAPGTAVRTPSRGTTIVRGVLWLGGAGQSQCVGRTGLRDSPCAALLDISGRSVLDLHPGANGVSLLAPGVYFVRPASGVMRSASGIERMTKVVITR